MKSIARRYGKTPAQVVFRFAIEVGMLPLTGTKNAVHMLENLDVFDFRLSISDCRSIERMADEGGGPPFRVKIRRPGEDK